MIITSLKSDAEARISPQTHGSSPMASTLEQYRLLFQGTDFPDLFQEYGDRHALRGRNHDGRERARCILAFAHAVLGSGILATGIFLTYLVPDTLLSFPCSRSCAGWGFLNSYWSMVLVYPTLTVPFCTWIMIGYFQSIPKELDEAALIDGAGHLQMLLKIFIPVALPGIIAATNLCFHGILGGLRLSHRISLQCRSAGAHGGNV